MVVWKKYISLVALMLFFFTFPCKTQTTDYTKTPQRLKEIPGPDYRFEHIGREQGLTAGSVLSIVQDHQGFMWFGTQDGLFRFDGYGMIVYKHDRLDTNSLGNNYIWDLFEDRDGTLWVGSSSGGLNRFDREKEQFVRYTQVAGDPNRLSSVLAKTIHQDPGGNLWIGTWRGLNKLDLDSEKITRFNHEPDDSASLNPYWIRSICEDSDGSLWLGTEGGVSRFQIQTGKFEHFVHDAADPHSVSGNYVNSVLIDQEGTLWVGSLGGLDRFDRETQRFIHYDVGAGVLSLLQDRSGALWVGTTKHLLLFDPASGRSTRFTHDPANPYSLSNNEAQCIYQDRTGALWFGTKNGVNRLELEQQRFKHIVHDPNDENSLSNRHISALHASQSGNIWVANWGKQGMAIDKIDSETKQIFRSLPGLQKENMKNTGIKTNLFEDRSGILWLSMDGLGRYDPKQGKLTRFVNESNNPHSLITNVVECTLEDRNGMLWVAIYHYGPTGISKFHRAQGRFEYINLIPDIPSNLSPKNGVASISEGPSGRLWFATKGDGIYLLNPGSKKFIQMTHQPGNPNSLSHSWVRVVHADQNGILWAAPWFGGLNKYDPETGQFTIYTEKDGLPSDDITSIVEDDRGCLWLTTQFSLSRFDPITEKFKNFNQDDGLVNDNFLAWHTSTKANTGEVFFGGNNGIDYIHPDSVKDNPHIPPVVFTRFIRYNTGDAGGKFIVEKGITEKQQVDLTHRDQTLTFEFAALNYRNPNKNQYAYKLEGFSDGWIQLGKKHEVTFTNLDPGEYVLHVKGSNNDGIWNEAGASLLINIRPPWWKTGWARALFGLLILGLLYSGRRYEMNRQQLKHDLEVEQIQAEKEHLEAQKLKEMDRLKSRFFANISHEFRTPLTLILGPLQQLLDQSPNTGQRDTFLRMRRNARRLERLINQLLDLSKLEAGKMTLHTQAEDLVQLTCFVAMAFESLAHLRGIALKLDLPDPPLMVHLDRDKYEKILANLLSNALKFTPEGGSILVSVGYANLHSLPEDRSGEIEIRVRDTGIGIPAEKLPHIFDRFYQSDDAANRTYEGTGIGLALTKELVELHGGEIRVKSEVGKGTTFTVRLPMGEAHMLEDEIVDISLHPPRPVEGDFLVSPFEGGPGGMSATASKPIIAQNTALSKILIVEDNPDMRQYMRGHLESSYRVMEAENGALGLKAAQQHSPDLIISDVMMPEMDGFALCEKLKTDARTSHIPVILLTARASGESKIEGLETGADDYLTKPFNARELTVRVKNLIEQRQRLQERFRRELIVQPSEVTVTSMDEAFLKKVIAVVEAHIDDTNFDTDTLASEAGVSRRHLNRKLRALTGQSARQFIRTIRLKRAAQLLQQQSGSVTEIAYDVGFQSLAHFAKVFREQFGVAPSGYVGEE